MLATTATPRLDTLALLVVRQTDDTTTLDDVCGDDPRWLCESVFDATGGNEFWARAVDWLIGVPLTILLIVVGAWVVLRLARRYLIRAIRKFMLPDRAAARRRLERLGMDRPEILLGHTDDDNAIGVRRAARAESITAVISSTIAVVVWVIAVVLVLGELGLNLGPLIAGAGIVGVALGFGAQSLVKDVLSGLFMLMEDQYGIGDVVDLGEASGVVEQIALRTTVLRGLDGTVWHVPNGEIQRVGNKSQLWSTALVDIDVAYETDLTAVRTILLDTANDLCRQDEWAPDVLDEPELLGVETLGADGITLRMIVKTAPGAQWALQRRLREAFKGALDGAGIEIPFPQRTVWMRGGDSG